MTTPAKKKFRLNEVEIYFGKPHESYIKINGKNIFFQGAEIHFSIDEYYPTLFIKLPSAFIMGKLKAKTKAKADKE